MSTKVVFAPGVLEYLQLNFADQLENIMANISNAVDQIDNQQFTGMTLDEIRLTDPDIAEQIETQLELANQEKHIIH